MIWKLLILDAVLDPCCCKQGLDKADLRLLLSLIIIFPVVGFVWWAGLNGSDWVFETKLGIHWRKAQYLELAFAVILLAAVLIPWVNFTIGLVERWVP